MATDNFTTCGKGRPRRSERFTVLPSDDRPGGMMVSPARAATMTGYSPYMIRLLTTGRRPIVRSVVSQGVRLIRVDDLEWVRAVSYPVGRTDD